MPNPKTSYKFIFEVIAVISIFFSIIWSIQVQKHQDIWQKKVETLHSLEGRDRSHLKYINARIDTISNSDSLIATILADSILKRHISAQLIIYEDLSIGNNIGIYDSEVIKRFMGTTFIKFNEKITPYILYLRKKKDNPNIYIEYDLCVKSLTENK